ncbi:hypothetical protein RUM43_001404 [Polyplax serrata]|uniref:EF-hand domain-containing protein n=1 Tax=Polyplax serrata TaxID=468196 RepID=A0AAN8XPP6_POLSC
MFPIPLETEPSVEDIPEVVAPREEPPEIIDEFALSITEDIFQCFALFDKTQSGVFPIKYLEKALKCLGIFLTTVELSDLEETMNTNGVVKYETFKNYAFDKLKEGDQFEYLKLAFRVFDPDDEGVIPSDRFRKWMTSLGNPLLDKEAKELVKMGDPAGKGFIVYEDLVGVLLS